MSYDVDIGIRSLNYTFNMSKLFYDHIPDTGKGGGLREIDGLTGASAARMLSRSFEAMSRTIWSCDVGTESAMREKYDAKNGWGSTLGAVLFLGQIIDACLAAPRSKVRLGL